MALPGMRAQLLAAFPGPVAAQARHRAVSGAAYRSSTGMASAAAVWCMDLASVYRALVRKHFPKARIVADRFHVIRLINHHFLDCWKQLDPVGSKHRGLLSLMRRHRHHLKPNQVDKLEAYFERVPVLRQIYRLKQRLCYLLLKKHRTRKQCAALAPRFLKASRPSPTERPA